MVQAEIQKALNNVNSVEDLDQIKNEIQNGIVVNGELNEDQLKNINENISNLIGQKNNTNMS